MCNEEVCKKQCHKSKIGGQALIEGVMMRGIDTASMSVRLGNGEIETETWSVPSYKERKWYMKTPIVRGIFNLIESMVTGYKCLMKSADKVELEDEDDGEPGKFEAWLMRTCGDKLMKIISVVAMVFGVAIAVALFMFLPSLITMGIGKLVTLGWTKTLVEGIVKIVLFVGYLAAVSRMKEIKRVFGYHGAEHKSIACYEAGEELTVENVRKHTRFHPRCGTSFLLISLIISIIVFSVVTWSNLYIRVALKIVLLPLVIGFAYELIKLAGRHDNLFTKIISAPGLWLQRLTTNEPDDSQIEVGIAALTAVIPEDIADDQW